VEHVRGCPVPPHQQFHQFPQYALLTLGP
jgi:hypothetical protein